MYDSTYIRTHALYESLTKVGYVAATDLIN